MSDLSPIRIAVIGSGPAGFYAAGHLLKDAVERVEVDMIERLPTPWGLVRSGVAPDHPKIKSVTRVYEKTAAHPRFRYFGNVTFGEHTGTHFDAPIHWFTGKDLPNNSVDTMPAKDMIAPACVIDCSAEAAKDPDFLLTVPLVEAWEAKHGRIPTRHWVLLRTDWSKKGWRDYANLGDDGAHTPGPNPAVMKWLVEERGIIGFGTETIGTDAGQAGHFQPPYPAHHFLHGGGRYGLQCLCNLDQLPPTGALIVASPLKIQNGSGSPLRVIALVSSS